MYKKGDLRVDFLVSDKERENLAYIQHTFDTIWVVGGEKELSWLIKDLQEAVKKIKELNQ